MRQFARIPFSQSPLLLALLLPLLAPGRLAAQTSGLFRDDTLGTLTPTQAQMALLFPLTPVAQPAYTCGSRFPADTDLTSPQPIIFYDLCSAGNTVRVSKAVDHLVVDCAFNFALRIADAPPPDSRAADARFVFAGGVGAVRCALDGAAALPCASPVRYRDLAEGPHQLALYGMDEAGQPRSGLVYEWRVDTRPPAAPELDWSPAARGGGAAVEFSGRGEPGATIVVRVSDGVPGVRPVEARVAADAAGRFGMTLDLSTLRDGPLAVTALAFDRAGNLSSTVPARTLTRPAGTRAYDPAAAPAWSVVPAAAFGGGKAPAVTNEAAACLSPDPSQWPDPSKPYFMVIVDSSSSMSTVIAGTNSCGYENTRLGHARCAVKKALQAFSGEAGFGLATWSSRITGCPAGTCGNCSGAATCYPGCTVGYAPGDDFSCGPIITEPALIAPLNITNHTAQGYANLTGTQSIHAGGLVAVPLVQDNYWNPPTGATNFTNIFNFVDNYCGNPEIGSGGNSPLGGALYNMNRYLAGTYTDPMSGAALPTPIGPAIFGGQPAERACRKISVILITDGDENCDSYDTGAYPAQEGLAVFEAGQLLSPGVTVSGQSFGIKTYVIGLGGGTPAGLNNIAAAGGSTAAYTTANDAQLTQALSAIVAGSLQPETCDNADNNCNGCTDEGFTHYFDQPKDIFTTYPTECCRWKTAAEKTACGANACVACGWVTAAQKTACAANAATCCGTKAADRATCLANYQASIAIQPPKGDLSLLPCTDAAAGAVPATWLCYEAGDSCDFIDNNGVGGVDERQLKCGSPLHCPLPEVCNGKDDDCDGVIDNGGICGATCLVTPSLEVCDGCDNDCNGIADDGVAAVPCGASGPGLPANCTGVQTCKPPQAVTPPGNCVAGGGWNACSSTPQTEICGDGLDNNCNGGQDDGNPSCPYGGRTEVCNGIDDNCDGQIDEGVVPPPNAAQLFCGVSPAATAYECTPGGGGGVRLDCISGAWKCTFNTFGVCNPTCATAAEICDAVDNNCNGLLNENVPNYGQPCASDTGQAPPGDGVCRATGTYVCLSANATKCSAVKDLTQAGPELCDGIDNDCDGLIDEPYSNKGTNATYYLKPAVTQIAAALWISSYEVSRPNATAASPGNGNGYNCTASTPCPAGTPVAPPTAPLDKTPGCSVSGKIPWLNATPIEAEQVCKAAGGHLCSAVEWQAACLTNPPSGSDCSWGYAPQGTACATALGPPYPVPFPTGGANFCNLGPTYDFNAGVGGDQDGLLVTASPALSNCYADWTALPGNSAATGKIYDLTGNLRELTTGSCRADSLTCTTPAECCSNLCVNGTCGCKGALAPCTVASQCCSNVCTGAPKRCSGGVAGTTSGDYRVMGGSHKTEDESGAACGFNFYSVNQNFQLFDEGFRCCFTTDPR